MVRGGGVGVNTLERVKGAKGKMCGWAVMEKQEWAKVKGNGLGCWRRWGMWNRVGVGVGWVVDGRGEGHGL